MGKCGGGVNSGADIEPPNPIWLGIDLRIRPLLFIPLTPRFGSLRFLSGFTSTSTTSLHVGGCQQNAVRFPEIRPEMPGDGPGGTPERMAALHATYLGGVHLDRSFGPRPSSDSRHLRHWCRIGRARHPQRAQEARHHRETPQQARNNPQHPQERRVLGRSGERDHRCCHNGSGRRWCRRSGHCRSRAWHRGHR